MLGQYSNLTVLRGLHKQSRTLKKLTGFKGDSLSGYVDLHTFPIVMDCVSWSCAAWNCDGYTSTSTCVIASHLVRRMCLCKISLNLIMHPRPEAVLTNCINDIATVVFELHTSRYKCVEYCSSGSC